MSLTVILSIALKNWKLVIMGLLAVAVVVQSARLENAKRDQVNLVTGKKWKVEAQRDSKALAVAREDLGQCQANNFQLTGSLAAQNASVEAWKIEALRRDANAVQAAQDARRARAVAESRARALADWKAAPTCPAREAAAVKLVEGLTR